MKKYVVLMLTVLVDEMVLSVPSACVQPSASSPEVLMSNPGAW